MLMGLRAHDPNRPSDSQNLVLYAKPSLSHKNKLKQIVDSRPAELYPLEDACQVAQLTQDVWNPTQKLSFLVANGNAYSRLIDYYKRVPFIPNG
jgi:hypothetical protein